MLPAMNAGMAVAATMASVSRVLSFSEFLPLSAAIYGLRLRRASRISNGRVRLMVRPLQHFVEGCGIVRASSLQDTPWGCWMKLVLADDNEVTRRLLDAMLTRAGHEVAAVSDGAAAVAAYERLRPSLVVLDWEMPVMDGLEATRRIRHEAGDEGVFVLMLTGRHGPGDLMNALNAGVDDYIVKPATPEHLEARLLIAERRIAQSAELARARWLAGIGETTLALQHEINNPLAALLGESEMLSMEKALPEPLGESVGVIVTSARRIAAVVKRLAALDQPQSVNYLNGARMLDLSGTREAE